MSQAGTALALRSVVTTDATVEVSLHEVEVAEPGPEQVVVRVEAAAVNPSDLGMLFAGADLQHAQGLRRDGRPLLVAPLSPGAARAAAARAGQPLPVGNEGAGTVVAAGSSDRAQALLGEVVGVAGGGMYAQLRCVNVGACQPFPSGTSAADGAGWFVNPMTASAMLGTMRNQGHTAIVHTAAASSLGRMLVRLCLADDVPLVNVVRRPEQAVELKALGAEHVCDSSSDTFSEELAKAVATTGATLAFDAIGGGTLVDEILGSMESALARDAPFDRYGSPVHKQVFIYGGLDRGPTSLQRSYGMSWSVGGWLVARALQHLGAAATAQMQARVASELKTTFATSFSAAISLTDALDPEIARVYGQASTGQKHLVDPTA